jgi:hypothetical protein
VNDRTTSTPETDYRPCCRHCRRPGLPLSSLSLCPRCHNAAGVRVLYNRPYRGRPAGWEQHLDSLALRAALNLPLFSRN